MTSEERISAKLDSIESKLDSVREAQARQSAGLAVIDERLEAERVRGREAHRQREETRSQLRAVERRLDVEEGRRKGAAALGVAGIAGSIINGIAMVWRSF